MKSARTKYEAVAVGDDAVAVPEQGQNIGRNAKAKVSKPTNMYRDTSIKFL
ncbi:MAG: hypothetical protein ACP5QA_11120 [Phycisphaerae bacterium]